MGNSKSVRTKNSGKSLAILIAMIAMRRYDAERIAR